MTSHLDTVPLGTAQVPDPDLFLAAIDRLYRDWDLGVMIEDADGNTRYANRELHTLLRLPFDDPDIHLGQPSEIYLAPALAWLTQPAGFFPLMQETRAAARSRVGEDIELIDDRYLERHYSPVTQGDELVAHLWIYREITRREADRREALEGRRRLSEANQTLYAANEELNRANRLLEALVHIQDLLLSTGDEETVFAEILQASLAMTNSSFGFFAEVVYDPDKDREVLVNRALTDIAWDAATQELYHHRDVVPMVFDNSKSLFGYVHRFGQPLITNDPQHHPESAGVPPGHPALESFAGLPILARGRVVGVMGLANSPRGYSQDLYEWMQPFLATCATVLINVRGTRERRNVMERLRVMSIRAEQASVAKNDFLSRMSHEVRTPINGMLGFAQLMAMRAQNETDRADAQRIVTAGRHLLGLFDDVIDLSTIEAGQISVRPETVDIHDLLHQCQEFVADLTSERGSTISHHINLPTPTATIDPLRLRQVVLNLLGNALKYSDEGSHVTISTSAFENHTLRIDVMDDGPGIPQDRWQSVFEPFWRLETTAAEVPGRGLGLSVSRSIAEMMGGHLTLLSSQPGRTIFRLEVPMTPLDAEPAIDDAPATPVTPLQGRVLYIEDVVDNADIVAASIALLHPQLALEIVGSAKQARAAWERERPDLVLLDLHLPDADGFELLDQLHPLGIPTVVLTADATPGTQHRIQQSNAHDSLIKPITLSDLDRLLQAQLSRT